MTDDLREQIARLDPMPSTVPTDPVKSDRARTLLEAVMSTPVLADEAPTPSPRPTRRRWYAAVAGAAAVVVLATGAAAVLANRGTDTATPPVALSLPATDPALSICAPFDAAVLGTAELAFAGTVTATSAGAVTLDVDRWYRGGTADQVTIAVPEGFTAALDGVDFATGQRYLVTASEQTVLGCGLSGPATPELEQGYAGAFGG